MDKNSVSIFSDGGARGNPGLAACAFVVFDNSKVLHKESKYLGSTTNNVAEYQGVLLALNWLADSGIQHQVSSVRFYLDSELIAKQLNGLYKVKDSELKNLLLLIKSLQEKIKVKIFFHHISRSKNKLADFLVNQELDKDRTA